MTIKTQIHLIILILFVFILSTGIVLHRNSNQVGSALKTLAEDQQVLNSAFMLKIFLEEYIDYFEERPRLQFEIEYERMLKFIKDRKLRKNDPIYEDIEDKLAKIKLLFQRLVTLPHSKELASHNEPFNLLNYYIEHIVSRISQMHAETAILAARIQTRTLMIIDISRLIFVTSILVLLFLIRRSVTDPISELLKAIDSLKNGIWNYKFRRIPQNELGSVMQSFNEMAERLDSTIKVLDAEIHERKQIQNNLERSNKDLELFAYVASHDLQEPLRNVTTTLQLFEKKNKGKFDQDSDQLIQYAVDGAKRMKSLIEDLLLYSRLSTKRQPFEEVNTEIILNKALDNLKILIEKSNAQITHDPLPVIWADGTQMIQVFQNLIQNAVKFGHAGETKIHISAGKADEGWLFSIEDNGIGIQQDYFEKIFVLFQQLEKKNPHNGTGMGLAIVKKIVNRHAGRVWVESEPGSGSTFFFTIPNVKQIL